VWGGTEQHYIDRQKVRWVLIKLSVGILRHGCRNM
jgi:hypothetical protein